jgi:tetratricopeptide (TPR) repeat protein
MAKELADMRVNFISIVSSALLLAWTSDASDQDVNEVEAFNKQILQLHQQGQYTQAMALAVKALKFSEDTLGPEHPETANCLNDLGGMYQSLGDYTNAETMFERGLAIREKVLGPEHQYTARNLMNLGSVYMQMGKYTNAEPLLLRALAINQKVLGPETQPLAWRIWEIFIQPWETMPKKNRTTNRFWPPARNYSAPNIRIQRRP